MTATPETMILLDPAGVVRSWNAAAAQLWHCPAETALGAPLAALFPPAQEALVTAGVTAVVQEGAVRVLPPLRPRPAPGAGALRVTLAPLCDGDQPPWAVVAQVHAVPPPPVTRRVPLRELVDILSEPPGGPLAPLYLHELVAALLEQTRRLAGVAGSAAFLYNSDTETWDAVAEAGDLPDYWPPAPDALDTLLAQVRRSHAPVRYAGPDGAAALLVVPLALGDRLIGAFALPEAGGPDPAARLRFITVAVGKAAVLIDNMQLRLQAEELAILEAHNRLARAMHDGLAQNLTQIRNRCEYVSRILYSDPARAAQELDAMRQALHSSMADVVRVIGALRPWPLDKRGLVPALQQLADDDRGAGQLRVQIDTPAAPLTLPLPVELALFRVVQEMLYLVAGQVPATACHVTLATAAGQVVLTITDNGDGAWAREHDARAGEAQRRLRALRSRVTELGGALNVQSTPGVGTQLTVTLPSASAYPHLDA
jgi:signal transduction histidine kinase